MEEMGALWPDTEQKSAFPILCHRYIATTLTGLLSLIAFFSPLAMLVLPKLGNFVFTYPLSYNMLLTNKIGVLIKFLYYKTKKSECF